MTDISTSYTTTTTSAASTGSSALAASESGTGLDYSALVEAKVAQRLLPADRIDQRITANEARITAYTDLQGYLQAVNSAIDGLRNRTSATGADENLFDARAAYLSDDSALSVTVEDGTETGVYSVEVVQLATRHKIGADTVASQSEALGQSGSFTLAVEGGTAVTIAVDAEDSLTDLRDAINAQKSTSGVGASIVQVSDGAYELILTAVDTGKAITLDDAGAGLLTGLGFTDDDGSFANELVAVQDAIIRVDGVEISRSSNTIDDAMEGITFDLYSAAPGETISVEVSEDLSSIKTAITDFVDAYNELRSFIQDQQSTTSSGTASDEATLFSDSLLRQVNAAVYDILNTTVTTGDGVMSLSSLGISFNSDNTLSIDETVLNSALTGNIEGVKQLLGLQMTSSSSDIQLLRFDQSIGPDSFSLDITMNEDGTIASATVGGDDSLFRVDGNRIIGNDGTAVAGLVLVYTGDSATVDLAFSQGLADQLYTAIAAYADSDEGTIATVIDQIEDDNSDLQTRSDTIRDRAEDYRTRLTAYYARLEAAAEEAALLLKQLTYSSDDDD